MKSRTWEDNSRAFYNTFYMWTVSSDVSIQRRNWQPLSVHLWAYCTHPTHDVNDVMCEGWPQHRGLRPLLFSNSGVGSFTSHKNKSVKVLWDGTYGFSSLSEKTRKSNCLQMSLERQHFLLSYLKSLSVVPAGVRTPDLPLSRPALPHCWANQGAVILRTLINSKTGFGNLKWFPSSVSLTVSCSWGCEQKTMGTFSGDAKDAGKGKLENEII